MKKTLYCILVISLHTSAYAGLPDSFGFSAVGIGNAGARTANVGDWASPFYNMAGLASPSRSYYERISNEQKRDTDIKPNELILKNTGEIGISYIYQITNAKILPSVSNSRISENIQAALENMSYGILELGLNFDLRHIVKTPYDVPVRFGLVMALRDNGTIVSINDTSIESYNFLRYGREAQTITVIPGIGFQIWKDKISLGIGANIAIGGGGAFQIAQVDLAPGELQVPRHDIKMDMKPSISPVLGVMYAEELPNFNGHIFFFGFNFKGESKLELTPLSVQAETKLLDIELPINIALLDFYMPSIFAVGVGYQMPISFFIIGMNLELEHQRWSNFRVSSSKVEFYSLHDIPIPNFHDISIYKSSIEFNPFLLPIEFRLGYKYQPAFTPEQEQNTNFLDNGRHVLAIGYTHNFKKNFIIKAKSAVNLGLQYQFAKNRENIKNIDIEIQDSPSYSYDADVFLMSIDFVLYF